MNKRQEEYEKQAIDLLRNSSEGVLSTISVRNEGYPFGSFVTYVTSSARTAYLYLSDLADHTKNLHHSSKSSLTILKLNTNGDKQNSERLTIMGDLVPVSENELDSCKKRYYQKDGIGKAKYTISYHDGKKKHKDGSDFFDIQIFRNKKDLAKFVNTLHKGGYVYGFGESVNEGKYNYKADALTAYFKGKIDAKELDKIARDDFKSGIATKKELSNFLSNKFTQDVMSDTYGIPAGTLIKRVRGLMKFAEGVDIVDQAFLKAKPVKESEDGVPQGYNPMVESKTKESKVVQMIYKYEKNEKKFYDKMAEHEKRIGTSEYKRFIAKALRGFDINPQKYKFIPDAEEILYQTVSK